MNAPLLLVLLVALAGVAQSKRLVFENRLPYTVWAGSLGNDGKTPINGGGWEMRGGSSIEFQIDDNWAGRFWGRTGCNFDGAGNGRCETGDCGGLKCDGRGGTPPVTLAEFTLNGWQGQDFYDISMVDGTNIPVSLGPLDNIGSGNPDHYHCTLASCPNDINGDCPNELRQIVDGRTVGCKSACFAFGTDEYCCAGQHNTPQTCQSSMWAVNYPAYFKGKCPEAYSYAYDDQKSTFTCENNSGYKVTFG